MIDDSVESERGLAVFGCRYLLSDAQDEECGFRGQATDG